MRRTVALFLLMGFVFVALIGCGIPQEKYNAILKEKKDLETKLTKLENDQNLLKTELEKSSKINATIKSAYDKLITDKAMLEVEIEKIKSEKAVIEEKKPVPTP